jgi:putative FmdB family regulatory protein
MPIYEYRCDRGHTFEVIQRMTDDPVADCERCGAAVQRVFHPVAVHFKGSGFYNTDYGKRKRGAAGAEASGSKDEGGSSSKAEKATSSASDSGSNSSSSSSSTSD